MSESHEKYVEDAITQALHGLLGGTHAPQQVLELLCSHLGADCVRLRFIEVDGGLEVLAFSLPPIKADSAPTAFWQDGPALRRMGNSMEALLSERRGVRGCLFIERDSGSYSAQDEERMLLLLPQLDAVLPAYLQMRIAHEQAVAAASALDRLTLGVVMVDSELNVQYANDFAVALLAPNDVAPLFLRGDSIVVRDKRDDRRLRRLISETTADRPCEVDVPDILRLAPRLARKGASEGNSSHNFASAMFIRVIPVGSETDRVGARWFPATKLAAGEACALLLLTRTPVFLAGGVPHVLRGLYGLTPKEAELAAALATGRTVQEYAESVGVSTHTIRNHLKNVFPKVNVLSQVELVHAILSGPAAWLVRDLGSSDQAGVEVAREEE